MPRIPLSNSHGKSVNVFVHLVQEGDRLNDHIVGSARVEFYLGGGNTYIRCSIRLKA